MNKVLASLIVAAFSLTFTGQAGENCSKAKTACAVKDQTACAQKAATACSGQSAKAKTVKRVNATAKGAYLAQK